MSLGAQTEETKTLHQTRSCRASKLADWVHLQTHLMVRTETAYSANRSACLASLIQMLLLTGRFR